jgi:SNF2 family DNA or RNA helicase
MNQEKIVYLVFDKYAKNSGFDNKFTKNVNVETLFSGDYEYYEGDNAIKEYNKFFEKTREDLKIPETLTNYNGLYNLYYFVYSVNGLEHRFLVVGVNTEKLEQNFKNNNEIPESNFLIKLCDYDKKYKTGGVSSVSNSEKDGLIKKNIKNITTKVIEPNADPTDPIEEQPDFASLPLYEYQKKTIKWMLTKEQEKRNICLNDNEIVLGNVICDTYMKKIISIDTRENIEFHGGALIDEVGLGKTYQTLTMSLCNPAKNKNYLWDSDKEIHSKATLIICPNQLVGQWIRETENVFKKDSNISVIPFFTKVHMNKYTYKDVLNADFVVTSYTFLSNKCFLDPFVSKISKSKSYISSTSFSHIDVEKVLTEMKCELRSNLDKKMDEKDVDLLSVMWHRVVVDEIHELYCVDKYKHLERLMPHFKSTYKWCLSGTPFDKSDESMNGMFDFITNYKNKSLGKEIWLNDEVIKHMMGNFFRRNTKKSVEDENKLPPLKENIVWLNFSKTEWMMYNAFLANPNIDKFSVTLRQLCCHPKIADELKASISNCKSLDEIEKVMVKHYETTMNYASTKMKLAQCRLKCLERKLEIAEWKQYARCLRKIGFRIKFELDIDNKLEKEMEELSKGIHDDELALPVLDEFDDVLKDDEENAENMKKKLIVISPKNKDKIIEITKKDIGDKSMMRQNIEKLIAETQIKIDTLTKDYNGKKSTHDFYANVIKQLKKTSEIENPDTDTDDSDDEEKETCGICLGNITGNDLGVTKCGHIFCYNCVKPFIESKHKCPMCQKNTTSSEIYLISKVKPEEETKEFKDKQSLINIVGTKLANLIFFLKKNDKHAIIFSQWDDLLKRVGEVLNDNGIKNVFCKGNVWQRDKAIREFNTDSKIKVIMLSSESAASGTNLTKAEMVILLDPVYGSYEYRRNTEWQAIGRAYRTGQTKQVQVVRFIIKDTVEQDIYNMNINADKNAIIKQYEDTSEIKDDNINLDNKEIEQLVSAAKEIKEAKKGRVSRKKVDEIQEDGEKDKVKEKVVRKRAVKKPVVEISSSSESSSDDESEDDAPRRVYNKK